MTNTLNYHKMSNTAKGILYDSHYGFGGYFGDNKIYVQPTTYTAAGIGYTMTSGSTVNGKTVETFANPTLPGLQIVATSSTSGNTKSVDISYQQNGQQVADTNVQAIKGSSGSTITYKQSLGGDETTYNAQLGTTGNVQTITATGTMSDGSEFTMTGTPVSGGLKLQFVETNPDLSGLVFTKTIHTTPAPASTSNLASDADTGLSSLIGTISGVQKEAKAQETQAILPEPSADVPDETYLSASENEAEPDGDDDDGNFALPSPDGGGVTPPPNTMPIATDGGAGVGGGAMAASLHATAAVNQAAMGQAASATDGGAGVGGGAMAASLHATAAVNQAAMGQAASATDGGAGVGGGAMAASLHATAAVNQAASAAISVADFQPRAGIIANNFATIYQRQVHYEFTIAADNTVYDKIETADGKTLLNYVVVDANGLVVNNAINKDGSTWATSGDAVGSAGPAIPWTVQQTTATGNPAGTIIHNADASEMQLAYHIDATGKFSMDDLALYDTSGNDLAAVAIPSLNVSAATISAAITDSANYGMAQTMLFLKDGYNVSAADQAAASTITGNGVAVLTRLAAASALTADATALFNDYKNNIDPYQAITSLLQDASGAVLSAITAVTGTATAAWLTTSKAGQVTNQFGSVFATHVLDDALATNRAALPTFTWH